MCPTPRLSLCVLVPLVALLGGCATASRPVASPKGGSAAAPTVAALDISVLDQVPMATFQARPQYPANLREKRVKGEAVVDFIVDVDGNVRNAFVLRATHPEFDEAALNAVAQWTFKPGMLGGRVVTHAHAGADCVHAE